MVQRVIPPVVNRDKVYSFLIGTHAKVYKPFLDPSLLTGSEASLMSRSTQLPTVLLLTPTELKILS